MSERFPAMSDPAQLPAADAAEVWLVRREGGLDIEADPAFARWLSADPDNVKAWASTSAFWDRVGEDEADPLLQAIRREALTARPKPEPRWGLAAASVAAVLVAGVLGWTLIGTRAPQPPAGPWIAANTEASFSNGRAPPKTVDLPDGSRVTLDAETAVAVAYAGPRRGVRLLKGQAFFDVVHDPARPFRVEVGDRWVSDLGTSFDVRLTESSLVVTVASGKVSVGAPKTHEAIVGGGQAVTVSAEGPGPIVAADPGASSWRGGVLKFHDTPLKDAVTEMTRYGGAPVVVTGADTLRVSGQFRAGDPRRFAHALAEIYPIDVRDRADGVVEIRDRPTR